ncbi:NifB/NifX family molybdenum-iron cluster-binding protein [Methanobacterium aggregans]|uniref:NifB/NifX family molybdenum-iron cluster-binding protein n=1 Tax=Methanobacterium aggregans TaxID=1615586 RepID=UPI001AEB3599|nr:NifB/NifX family molybdenum-iron cluster-binding protein [Methanobacterium aggregans]
MFKIKNLCFPTEDEKGLNSPICPHFGKTPYLTILKIEDDIVMDLEAFETHGRHSGGHATAAEVILVNDGDIVVCGNLGAKAVEMLSNGGVQVFSGATGTVNQAFQQWKNGDLKPGSLEPCTASHD